MKNLTFIIAITLHCSLFTVHAFSQPCLPDGIVFYSQEQIDSFQVNYPGCTEIEGNVTISGGSDISNLNGLSVLTSIGGFFFIGHDQGFANPNLTSLTGLENLTFIGETLKIWANEGLTSLTGLESLTSIGGYLGILYNPALTSLTGLENLTSIEGFLDISVNAALTSLTGLENLTSIEGMSIAANNTLTTLAGMNGLTSIGGSLDISYNPMLTSLTGLETISTIGGALQIKRNNALTSLLGLENLSSIAGDLTIGDYSNYSYNGNPALSDISSLGNLAAESINNLIISYNASLSSCEVQSICDYLASPNGTVTIHNNAQGCNNPWEIANDCGYVLSCLPYGIYYFTKQSDIDNFADFTDCVELEGDVQVFGDDISNLNGLNIVTSIEGDLTLMDNYALPCLTGLENLTSIGGDLGIGEYFYGGGNPYLASLTGLENLTSIGGNLRISDNDVLTILTGMESLASIGENLHIIHNTALTSLIELDNLTSIGEVLMIIDNHALTSLTGLGNINPSSIESITIGENEMLSDCDVQSICDYLAAPNGTIEIHDNAPGCNNQQQVQDACDSITSIGELTKDKTFTISPNPLESTTLIEYTLLQNSPVTIKILNLSGWEMITLVDEVQQQGEQKVVFNTSGLPAGVYFCVLKTSPADARQTRKIIKLD